MTNSDFPSNSTNPNGPCSTASTSLYKRHGLSPRQRRLLQAAARARAHPPELFSPLHSSSGAVTHSTPPIHSSGTTSSLARESSASPPISPVPRSPRKPVQTLASSLDKLNINEAERNNSTGGSGASTAITDATTASLAIGDGLRKLRLSPVHDVSEGVVAEAMRGKVSDHVRRFNKNFSCDMDTPRARGGKFRKKRQENDDNDQEPNRPHDSLVNRVEICKPTIQTNPIANHQVQFNDRSKFNIHTSQKLNAQDYNKAPTKVELRHYRVIYRGVISLLEQIDTGQSNEIPSERVFSPKTKQKPQLKDHASVGRDLFVGYGDILATSLPEIEIHNPDVEEMNDSLVMNNTEFIGSGRKSIKFIRVDAILTRDCSPMQQHPARFMDDCDASTNISETNHFGFLPLWDLTGGAIAQLIAPSDQTFERGPFVYRVRSTSPVRVVSGPEFDAPSMNFALLPGTIHHVSFRISVPTSDPIDADEAGDILVDDADASEVLFLLLSQRRGWVADRSVSYVDGDSKRLRVSYSMQDISCDSRLNPSLAHHASSTGACAQAKLHIHDDPSMTFSSNLNSSFYLSVRASSIKTPSQITDRRKSALERRRTRESRLFTVGESTDTESLTSGIPNGTTVSSASDNLSVDHKSISLTKTLHLMRVTAPMGLKILDAPHFQVSNLIHTPSSNGEKSTRQYSPSGLSPFSRTNAMIGSMSAETSPLYPGERKKINRIRILPRGQFFEAENRMERNDASSLYTNSRGLIKLSDGSGWVIIPHHNDLLEQYQNCLGSSFSPREVAAYEEVGNASIHNPLPISQLASTSNANPSQILLQNVVWLRITTPNGVKVLLPPSDIARGSNNTLTHVTPQKNALKEERQIGVKHSSSSLDSEVASAVSSSFFDSVLGKVTPTKHKELGEISFSDRLAHTVNNYSKQQRKSPTHDHDHYFISLSQIPIISCGMVVPTEYAESYAAPYNNNDRFFVRLFNGQGWIPRMIAGVTCATRVESPEARFGSFWFRVQSINGIDVRHGPSTQAHFITSDCGASFRFECGEFLRASEVITIYHCVSNSNDKSDLRAECFAKLYRKCHSSKADDSDDSTLSRYASLQAYTAPGEWVMVHSSDDLFLEECSIPPLIERNREGWRCAAMQDVPIRRGPSFRSEPTNNVIHADEKFFVCEKVTAAGDDVTWLKLKNNEGWVHSTSDDGDIVVCFNVDSA